jgi:hypothetical protein
MIRKKDFNFLCEIMTILNSGKEELIKKLKETFERIVEKKLGNDKSLIKISKENLKIKFKDQDILNRMSEFTDSLIRLIIQENEEIPELTNDKRKRILSRASDYDDYYENLTDDEVLFGLKID